MWPRAILLSGVPLASKRREGWYRTSEAFSSCRPWPPVLPTLALTWLPLAFISAHLPRLKPKRSCPQLHKSNQRSPESRSAPQSHRLPVLCSTQGSPLPVLISCGPDSSTVEGQSSENRPSSTGSLKGSSTSVHGLKVAQRRG